MPLIYYRASLQGTAEGEDAVSFISSDTNKQLSLTNRSRSPSIKPAASEGTSHKVNTESAVLMQYHYIKGRRVHNVLSEAPVTITNYFLYRRSADLTREQTAEKVRVDAY